MNYDVNKFAKFLQTGKFALYSNRYNVFINLIDRFPEDLLSKVRLLLENEGVKIFDYKNRNVFCMVLGQDKILPDEKMQFFEAFMGKIDKEQFENAIFSVDVEGNHMMSQMILLIFYAKLRFYY